MGAGESEREALAELKERLRRLRAERRFSMTVLERRAQLGHTTVSRALNGPTVPSQATVVAIARALGTEAGPLLKLRSQAQPRTARVEVLAGAHAASRVDEQFEDRYRQYAVQRHGQISVVGLDLSRPERTCWSLDAGPPTRPDCGG